MSWILSLLSNLIHIVINLAILLQAESRLPPHLLCFFTAAKRKLVSKCSRTPRASKSCSTYCIVPDPDHSSMTKVKDYRTENSNNTNISVNIVGALPSF